MSTDSDAGVAESDRPQKSQALEIVEMAESRFRFATTDTGEPIAVELDGPNIARPLRGGRYSLRSELAACYRHSHKRVPSQSALADALVVIEGEASDESVDASLRVGAHDGGLVVDLGDADGRAVVITPGSWSVKSRSPILFRRTELTGVLPEPSRPGPTGLDELRSFVHINDESWPLVVGWLVASVFPDIAHPIPALFGEQGTGKSTAARRLASLVDPSPAPLRSSPRDVHEWSIVASGSWVIALDNLSEIRPWLSDALCRAATGDGLVKRRLYADDSLVVLNFRRCPILTAIDAGALKGDLADRLLVFEMERIAGSERRTDADLDAAWNDAHPRILGALFNLVGEVLRVLPSVTLASHPRMADFARILAAIDKVRDGDGLGGYERLGTRIATDVVDGDEVALALQDLPASDASDASDATFRTFSGSASELLRLLNDRRGDKERPPKDWPTTAARLSGRIRRCAPALRGLGVHVDFTRDGQRGRTITITKETTKAPAEKARKTASLPSHASLGPDDDLGAWTRDTFESPNGDGVYDGRQGLRDAAAEWAE